MIQSYKPHPNLPAHLTLRETVTWPFRVKLQPTLQESYNHSTLIKPLEPSFCCSTEVNFWELADVPNGTSANLILPPVLCRCWRISPTVTVVCHSSRWYSSSCAWSCDRAARQSWHPIGCLRGSKKHFPELKKEGNLPQRKKEGLWIGTNTQ